jgi:hypothetical protein
MSPTPWSSSAMFPPPRAKPRPGQRESLHSPFFEGPGMWGSAGEGDLPSTRGPV